MPADKVTARTVGALRDQGRQVDVFNNTRLRDAPGLLQYAYLVLDGTLYIALHCVLAWEDDGRKQSRGGEREASTAQPNSSSPPQ